MTKQQMVIAWNNLFDAATITASSEHPSFPVENVQHRFFKKPWRSKYGAGSNWGLFRITTANQKLYFTEGAGTLTATLTTGDYDTTTLCAEIKLQLEAAGAGTYTITYSDVTNKFTLLKSAGTFELVCTTTTNSVWDAIGFLTAVDKTGALTYTSDNLRIHTEEEIKIDLGSAQTIKLIAAKFNNLQATATVSIKYYSDAWITLQLTDPIPYKADIMAIAEDVSYQYAKLHIIDKDNPDLYVEIGRIYGGNYFEPHYNFTTDMTWTGNDPSVEYESEDGQISTIQLSRFKEWNYAFDAIYPNDAADFNEIFESVGTSKALWICENINAADITEYMHYVKFASWEWVNVANKWTAPAEHWRSLAIGIKEER